MTPPERPTRLQRKVLARRRMVRRRRRLAVFALLLVAGLAAGFDFARGAITDPDPPVRAQGDHSSPQASPPSSAAASPTPSPSPSKSEKPSVPYSGSGKFVTAGGEAGPVGKGGATLRYRVQVEKGAGLDADEFAGYVDATLADERSWIAGGDVRLQRAASGPYNFTVYLATPTTTDRLCAPLPTSGYTSCRQGDSVVVNLARWVLGVPHWDRDLDSYRQYVINHEVGHRLGHGHVLCSGKGDPAPVMQQQTLKLAGCKGNAWPYVKGKLHSGPPGQYS